VSCADGRRVWELVTCTVGSKTIISSMAFLSRISNRLRTQNLESLLFYPSFWFFLFLFLVYGNYDSVFQKFISFIAAASPLFSVTVLRKCELSKYSACFYVPQDGTFNNYTFCSHSVFMCFVWISEQTAIISLYIIN
jgi:hypothetical protein